MNLLLAPLNPNSGIALDADIVERRQARFFFKSLVADLLRCELGSLTAIVFADKGERKRPVCPIRECKLLRVSPSGHIDVAIPPS